MKKGEEEEGREGEIGWEEGGGRSVNVSPLPTSKFSNIRKSALIEVKEERRVLQEK